MLALLVYIRVSKKNLPIMENATNVSGKDAYLEAVRRIVLCDSSQQADLDLSNLGILELPPEIGKLTWLRELNLSQNQLKALPATLANLHDLHQLLLGNNKFRTVPSVISKLEFLRDLELDNNQLSSLPKWIGSLSLLEHLNIGSNKIEKLPAEIGLLGQLEGFHAYGNNLEVLPDEICYLLSLEMATFFGNELSVLPENIGNLSNLDYLDLYQNELTGLPSSFVNLTNISQLDLGSNLLRTVPKELRGLKNLQILHLAGNQLRTLPEWFLQLPKLDRLDLNANPALKLAPTILGERSQHLGDENTASAKAVLDFYFGRKGETRPLNEVKLVLVGRGGAGKTSLVRALQDQSFNDDESSTPGIALCDWTMNGARGAAITAHVWDFAGQVITHALHQFFFSTRCVYVLVLTGRENNERDDAEYWLRLIKAFGTDDQGNGPAVIIALNKWDVTGCRPSVDRSALQERYPFIRSFIETDCKTGKGTSRLKSALYREAAKLKWVRDPFPEPWDRVRRALTIGSGRKAHLTYAAYRALCVEHNITDSRQQDSLAEVLHNLGVALNYRNDPRLREATVLQPEWLTKNVYSLVRRAEKQAGLLRQSDIDAVLSREKDSAMRAYLVRIMERFEIAYSPRGASEYWLVPQALADQQAKGVAAFRDAVDATRLRYVYQALPEGLVARAIVRLNDLIEEIDEKKQQWASGVIIERAGARALIRTEPQDRQVIIVVTGEVKARQQLAGLCQAEMRDIHMEIRGLDPTEETQVQGTWVSTKTLEIDERNRNKTGVSTRERGTILIDPEVPNNEYSEKLARSENWKPTVFISYSKGNVFQRKQLEIQLKILMNEGLLERIWHDRMIDAGDDWDDSIQRQLKEADIVVILVSGASLATDYITRHEIPKAIELHRAAETVVIPIILEACRWAKTDLGALNALPEKALPINKWKRSSDGWNSVADGLALACEKLMSESGVRERIPLKRAIR